MTEPRTRLQAASLLGQAELPDPLRWDHLLKLLPQYKAVLTKAARSGELSTTTHTIEPKQPPRIERGPWFDAVTGELRQVPRQPAKAVRYTTVRLGDLRAYLEHRREPVPAWLAEVPAAPVAQPPAELAAQGGRAKADKEWGPQRAYAIQRAAELWDQYPEWRFHAIEDAIMDELHRQHLEVPLRETIRTWLKKAAQAGDLSIPESASRRGR